MLLWELLSNGQFPYSNYDNDTQLMNDIEAGLRLYAPHGSAKDLFDIMLTCWELQAERRPNMGMLLATIVRLQRSVSVPTAPENPAYQPVHNDDNVADLILFTRFVSPASVEYRPYAGAYVEGLFERIETFDGSVYHPASNRRSELYEKVPVYSSTVYAPIMTDELRPPGLLYVLRDKATARSELTRRRHLYRTAIESRRADPDVYRVVSKITSPDGSEESSWGNNLQGSTSYTIPVRINLPSDEDNGDDPPPVVGRSRLSTEVFSNPAGTKNETSQFYSKPDRRRARSVSSFPNEHAPPLPARASMRPPSVSGDGDVLHTIGPWGEKNRRETINRTPIQRERRTRPSNADQLTADEWVEVQTWLNRSVSRIQAEKVLIERWAEDPRSWALSLLFVSFFILFSLFLSLSLSLSLFSLSLLFFSISVSFSFSLFCLSVSLNFSLCVCLSVAPLFVIITLLFTMHQYSPFYPCFIAMENISFFPKLYIFCFISTRGYQGSYLVRRSERSKGEYALSLMGNGVVNHYRLIQMENDQVAMYDAVNGNRTFASMQSLIAFYKLLPPEAIGGLVARLAIVVPP